MKLNIDGRDYELGATHAGLDCWLSEGRVKLHERNAKHIGSAGDFARDEIIRYLANPDDFNTNVPQHGVLITDANDTRKRWPLRNQHRSYHTRKTEKLPDRGANAAIAAENTDAKLRHYGAAPVSPAPGWPRWLTNGNSIARLNSAKRGDGMYYGKTVAVTLGEAWWDGFGTRPITEAAAITWLKANGHESVAAELERTGERRPPAAGQAGATARVWKLRSGPDCFNFAMHRVDADNAGWRKDRHRGWEPSPSTTPLCSGALDYTELFGPEAAAIVNDLCKWVPSAAAILGRG